VPPKFIGRAAGFLAFGAAGGNLVGVVACGVLLAPPIFWNVYIFMTVSLFGLAIITIFGVRETQEPDIHEKYSFTEMCVFIVKSFYLPTNKYRNLYMVLLSRFFAEMGVSAFLPYVLYFLQDIMLLPDYQQWGSWNLAATMAAGIPTGIFAGRYSDRIGRKKIVYFSCTWMAVIQFWLIVTDYYPNNTAFIVSSALFGIGYGAYRAVDWALALDVVPHGTQIAKDMGIWHVALVLPRVISPLVSGAILNAYPNNKQTGYMIIFVISIVYMILSMTPVYFIRPQEKEELENDKMYTSSVKIDLE